MEYCKNGESNECVSFLPLPWMLWGGSYRLGRGVPLQPGQSCSPSVPRPGNSGSPRTPHTSHPPTAN